MASIRKRGNKHHVQICRNGFASRTRSFLKLSDAKEWARLVEGQADRNELAPCQKVLKATFLADLVARYRDEVVPKKNGAEVERIILNRLLRHPICRKRLSEITTADFAHYRDERLTEITAKSLKRQLSPIQNMFLHAMIEWE